MVELILVFVLLFGFGYGTRSYVGAFVPGAVLVFAVFLYQQSTPTGDEVDVLPAAFVVASGLGVLIYLGGVALGRRLRRISPDGA
jgi:4-hydroxybenzoate polyprenyltransferase